MTSLLLACGSEASPDAPAVSTAELLRTPAGSTPGSVETVRAGVASWVGLETPGGVLSIDRARFQAGIDVTNESPEPRIIDLEASIDMDGTIGAQSVAVGTLGPGETRRVFLDLSAFERELDGLLSSGIVTVRAHARDATGARRRGFAPPVAFFHALDGRTVAFYDRIARRERYDGGDFRGLADNVNAFGSVVPYHVAKGSIPLADIAGMALGDGPSVVPDGLTIAPSQAWTKVCLSVPVQFDDHVFGDLGVESHYALPGVRFSVENYQGNTIAEGNANHYAPSCVTVPTSEYSYTFHVHADSLISDDGREYRVATFDVDAVDGTDSVAWTGGDDDAAPSAETAVFTINHAYDTMHVTVSFDDPLIGQVHATSTNLLQRWEYLSTGQKSVPNYLARLDVRINTPDTVGTPQFASGDANEKFLIGHELGHIWHASLGASPGSGYGFSGIDGACISSGTGGSRAHMLRSAERAAPASEEAVAHLLAAVGFNYRDDPQESAEFMYYKSTLADGNWPGVGNDSYEEATNLVTLSAEVDLSVATAPNVATYLYDHCGCEEAQPLEYACNELGVELDWLRFLWAMLASDGALPGSRPPLDVLVEDVGKANDAFSGLVGSFNGALQQRALQAGCIYLGRCL